MENIAKELLPIAKSEMEKLKRELKIKYIADARYVMPNNNTAFIMMEIWKILKMANMKILENLLYYQ